MPVVTSHMKISTFASSMAIFTCFLISLSNTSSELATNPPVSTTLKVFPFQSATPYCRSRVTPLSSSTIAFRCSSRRLNRVDFPTFGRPTIAMVNPGICFYLNKRLAISSSLTTLSISVLPKVILIIPPFVSHFYQQLQEHFSFQEGFNLITGAGSQFFDHLSPFSENDPLLCFTGNHYLGRYFGQCRLFFKLRDQHRCMIRHLLFI